MKIDKTIAIEELLETVPQAVTYLFQEGIRCIRCGEPIWGTLEQAAREKGFGDEEIKRFVEDLNNMSGENDK